MAISGGHSRLAVQNSNNVDRNTSVRSVMTLPPYRHKPLENESVLGREGERDGIDVVIEMPTIEDEEALREGEMNALYQIRVARRRQIEEQEALRNARLQAQARNDQAALSLIREQSRAAATSNTQEIEALRGDHVRATESRARAVGSVSYAELGVARHDGTRIRANSSESERIGLLSDVGNIGMSGATTQSPAVLRASFDRPSIHQRGHSSSSVLSIGTAHSGDEPQDLQMHLQSTQTSTRSRVSSVGCERAGSSPELIDSSEASGRANSDEQPTSSPSQSPPSYDDVSLNDLTPAQTRTESPYIEPPPDYTLESTDTHSRRDSAYLTGPDVATLATDVSSSTVIVPSPPAAPMTEHGTTTTGDTGAQSLLRNGNALPRLPSLRLDPLPQIVIEPSSAGPREAEQ
ncbi:hypothetical protein SEPCBS57363_000564 [Sporothrix epigloea]|uniref:Uncharacterized protein n=1 Tax=Sporothrix epigloea TaxID=1892477 RepID=A0ABP0D5F1_9PEZI